MYLSSFLRSPDNSVVDKLHEEVYQVSLGVNDIATIMLSCVENFIFFIHMSSYICEVEVYLSQSCIDS